MESIKVNLIPRGVGETCHVSQYDVNRKIRLLLFDGVTPYYIKAADTFTLNVRKPDNTIITMSVTGTTGNDYLDIYTTEQMCAVVGFNLCEIRVENNGDNIGTLNFNMAVERDVLADGIPSESVIEDLDALVAEAVGDNFYNKDETDDLLALKADKSEVYDVYPVENVSGSIVTIDDGAENVPMKSLVVDIVPQQASGTPTPDNPLPISGTDEVVITHTGKNRLNKEDITTQSASWVLNNMPLVLLAGTYTLSFDFSGTSGAGSFRLDDASGTAIYTYNQTLINGRMSYTFTINQTASFIKLYCGAYGSFSKFMLCEGAITTYEPYTATTFTKELPRIIYGGEVDVVSGSGRETMGYIASYNGESINEPWISSMDVYTPGGTPTTGAEVVYPLATPTHISTTPTTIKTKGGTESIFADCGDVSGEYRADIAAYIQKKIAEGLSSQNREIVSLAKSNAEPETKPEESTEPNENEER